MDVASIAKFVHRSKAGVRRFIKTIDRHLREDPELSYEIKSFSNYLAEEVMKHTGQNPDEVILKNARETIKHNQPQVAKLEEKKRAAIDAVDGILNSDDVENFKEWLFRLSVQQNDLVEHRDKPIRFEPVSGSAGFINFLWWFFSDLESAGLDMDAMREIRSVLPK